MQVTETSQDTRTAKSKFLGMSLLFCFNISIGYTSPLVVADTFETYLGFITNATLAQEMIGRIGFIIYCIIWYPVNSLIMKKWLGKHEAYWLLAFLFLVFGFFVMIVLPTVYG